MRVKPGQGDWSASSEPSEDAEHDARPTESEKNVKGNVSHPRIAQSLAASEEHAQPVCQAIVCGCTRTTFVSRSR
jgi:hypothetical protein